MIGVKKDDNKVRPSLVLSDMPRALLAVAEVATFGAEKYSDGNWLHVDSALSRYTDAKDRHRLQGGIEERDIESGLLHAAHEAWNALAVLELMIRSSERVTNNWPESADARIDIIGANGNDGEHYGDETQLSYKLTIHDLLCGGWWCADTSEASRRVFELRGFNVTDDWKVKGADGCKLTGKENVTRFRGMSKTKDLREITLVDGEFYYCKSQSLGDSSTKQNKKPLTRDELMQQSWFMSSATLEDRDAFIANGVPVGPLDDWDVQVDGIYNYAGDSEIHRIGNSFYWGAPE